MEQVDHAGQRGAEHAPIHPEQEEQIQQDVSDAHDRHHHGNGFMFSVQAKEPERDIDQNLRSRSDSTAQSPLRLSRYSKMRI